MHSKSLRVFWSAEPLGAAAGLIIFFCTVFFAFPLPSAAGTPVPRARIVYTAETHGQLHPCDTCGTAATGGMPRRATLLARLAAETPSPLILAGPGEFTPPGQRQAGRHPVPPHLAAVFARMPYSALYISAPAVKVPPQEQHLPASVFVGDAPVTRWYRAGSLRAACVFFPPVSNGAGPTPDQLEAVRHAAKNAAKEADLVIGISPWGLAAENAAIPFLSPYIHILLGGGSGLALPGQATGSPASPGPLWARAASLGRAVVVLDIISLPQGPSTPWLEGIHFMPHLVLLDDTIPEDPAMGRLITPAP